MADSKPLPEPKLTPDAKRALASLKRPVPKTSEDEHFTTEALMNKPVVSAMELARQVDHSEHRVNR